MFPTFQEIESFFYDEDKDLGKLRDQSYCATLFSGESENN